MSKESKSDSPSFPTAEGGVSATPDRMLLVTGTFKGMKQYNVEWMLKGIRQGTHAMFKNRVRFWNNHSEFALLLMGSDVEIETFMDFYKKSVEIWGCDINNSVQYNISELGPIV